MKSQFFKMHTTNMVSLICEGWNVLEIEEGENVVFYLCENGNTQMWFPFDYLGNRL